MPEPLDSELEKMLMQVKLKEPKPEEMTNYLADVRSKIHFRQKERRFHFVPIGIAVASALVLFGLIYLFVLNPQKPQPAAVSRSMQHVQPPASRKNLSLADEMAVLEAFSEEYPTGTSDLMGDEGAMNDLVLMDEIEFAAYPS